MKMNGYWVYTITTPDGMVYVGMSGKKYTSQRWQPSHYKETSLEPYIKICGWENLKKEVVQSDILTESEAKNIENKIILKHRENCCCINGYRSGNVTKNIKYKHNYTEEHKEERKSYLEKNKERFIEYKKQYREEHKEEIKVSWKNYYEKNKKVLLEKRRKYRERNKQEKQFKEQGYISLF